MPACFKKRQKIINDEILDEKESRIYLERQIKKLIKKRYQNREIDLKSSYMYQKMAVLLDNKIYLEARGLPKKYVVPSGYVNVFDLHRRLSEIIRVRHLPQKYKKIYTQKEREYMKKII